VTDVGRDVKTLGNLLREVWVIQRDVEDLHGSVARLEARLEFLMETEQAEPPTAATAEGSR